VKRGRALTAAQFVVIPFATPALTLSPALNVLFKLQMISQRQKNSGKMTIRFCGGIEFVVRTNMIAQLTSPASLMVSKDGETRLASVAPAAVLFVPDT